MEDEKSLEGWEPEIGREASLGEVIEHAFDYRGNVTVELTDGSTFVGYLFDRNADAAEPYVRLLDTAGDGPVRFRYADIATIRFTGRDTAKGKSYEAWKRKQAQKHAPVDAPGAGDA